MRRQCAGRAGTDEERDEGDDWRDDRQARATSDAEAEEDDVAGHVRREDMAQTQIADRVDEARREGEREQRSGQGMAQRGFGHPGT